VNAEIPVQPRASIRELAGYHSPQVDVPVRLNTNESPYGPPAEFLKRWAAAICGESWNRYPDRSARDLREGLGRLYGRRGAEVICGNGSNEVLQAIFLAHGGPGRRALTFEPSYALHDVIGRTTATEMIACERASDFSLDRSAAEIAIERAQPHITFLTSPNNPTGRVESRDTVEWLADMVPGLLVIDAAYAEFSEWDPIDLVDDSRPIVVTRTYSKVWSMAGLRLGYAVAPTWLVGQLEQVLLPYHLSTAVLRGGSLALEYQDEMAERVDKLKRERDRLYEALEADGRLSVWPSAANFILFRPAADGHRVWERLLERGVLVRDCSSWDRLAGCLRVTVGTPEENSTFLEALDSALDSLGFASKH